MTRAILASTILALLVASPAGAQQTPAAIFSVPDAAAGRAATSAVLSLKGVAERQLVGMRLDRLFDGAQRVLLNVDGREWIASFERSGADAQGYRTWVGSIEGIDYSHVSFAERNGVVSGLINGVTATYTINTIGAGVYTLDRVLDLTVGELEPRIPPPSSSPVPADAALTAAGDDGTVIDALMFYTPGARTALGGVDQMNARIAQIINDTNTIFQRSGITPRLRLVGAIEAALPETTDMVADLDAFSANASVNNSRNLLNADLVQLLQNSPSTTACGVGWLLTSVSNPSTFPGFSIADISPGCVYTSTHEMGHNMGSHHDPDNAGAYSTIGGPAYPFSYGYRDTIRGFRTVMAYACPSTSCPRIPNFSNPAVNHASGFPTGTASQNNALSINNTSIAVANFRQSAPAVLPAPPASLAAQVSGLGVTLSWAAAAAATGYVLQVGSTSGVYNLLTYPVGSATSISGSAPAGTYYWRVFGTNSAGNGPPSAEAQFTLGGCVPPSAPQTFTHTVGAGRIVSLSWSAPASGAAPFSYIIDAGTGSGLANILSAPVGGITALSVVAPPGTYFVRIRAANACAPTSAASNERVIVVP